MPGGWSVQELLGYRRKRFYPLFSLQAAVNIADSSPKTILVFNLDGTLSRQDTFLAYLLSFLVRHPWRIYRLAQLPSWAWA